MADHPAPTPADRAELRRLLAEAGFPQWRVCDLGPCDSPQIDDARTGKPVGECGEHTELVVAAINALPGLLDALDAAENAGKWTRKVPPATLQEDFRALAEAAGGVFDAEVVEDARGADLDAADARDREWAAHVAPLLAWVDHVAMRPGPHGLTGNEAGARLLLRRMVEAAGVQIHPVGSEENP